MTKIIFISFLICIVPLFAVVCGPPQILQSEKIVKEINDDKKSTWKADTYGTKEINVEEFKQKYLGVILPFKYDKNKEMEKELSQKEYGILKAKEEKLPAYFNWAKTNKTNCPVGRIRDQSNCGSCWAVSTASAMQDRFCIQSGGKINVELSSGYITACDQSNYACRGGFMNRVYDFLKINGTITGGDYDSDVGCQPYSIKPCGPFLDSHKMPCVYYLANNPKCRKKKCSNDWYKYQEEPESSTYKYSRWSFIKGNISYTTEYLMRKEIYENGPITAAFLIYSNFLYYKKGIYIPIRSWPMGGHAVKVVGWGEEDSVLYWIAQNSWSDRWGENGFFRILRGTNAGYFESMVNEGKPDIKKS
ncbi:hypothetical protein PGB90_001872 [Kerria lacca]